MVPENIPHSVIVLGSGAIGAEFASFYCSMGTKVIMCEIAGQILPAEDEEVSNFVRKQFQARGISIHTNVAIEREKPKNQNAVAVRISKKDGNSETLEAEKLILAVGVQGNSEECGLEKTQALVENGLVMTDEWGRTREPGLYAIGDIAGPPMLAHKAEHEAIACVEKIAGLKTASAVETSRIPACTYCMPQIASIGMTEKSARAQNYSIRVGKFPFSANGKALATGGQHGFAKMIFEAETGQLLGAHLAGAEVTELIHSLSIAMTLETTEAELMHAVFPHPTVSESLLEATLKAYDRPIHM